MLRKATTFSHLLPFSFANINIPPPQIFFSQRNVVGLVNLKPAVPGHVLVCPRRPVQRIKDLEANETIELWLGLAEVQRMIEEKYQKPCNIAIQDGVDAGQTVPHVHVHVYPEYDEKEVKIQESESRKPREPHVMAAEASIYRQYLQIENNNNNN